MHLISSEDLTITLLIRALFSLFFSLHFGLLWVFTAVPGLSLVVGSRDSSLLQRAGSVGVVPELSCPKACGDFLDQRLSPCPHQQADSYPLDHQTNPELRL